ncbi:hypothetical protein phi1422_0032 [Bdellovibrio phage phi1422]|uniref:hypothetical protein n=1 Tax=Bdellovibrio phage phi1422 TaxID=1127515 RepID=UPI0002536D54|nr:hypothetical protein F395_gp32 [Bdellovibrio phage phi1422]AFC22552.1 hypothetical protein phi1422_0032 [Bdellovibrio phage phi1422]
MKKAKSQASKRKAKTNPKHIGFTIDRRYTLDDLSKQMQRRVAVRAHHIKVVIQQHNDLCDTQDYWSSQKFLTKKSADNMNAACLFLEHTVDTMIADFNLFLDKIFAQVWKKQDARKTKRKFKSQSVNTKKLTEKVPRKKAQSQVEKLLKKLHAKNKKEVEKYVELLKAESKKKKDFNGT